MHVRPGPHSANLRSLIHMLIALSATQRQHGQLARSGMPEQGKVLNQEHIAAAIAAKVDLRE